MDTFPPVLILPFRKFDIISSLLGAIMRQTIPKSYGRQVWYDVKHSRWGDAIPYTSKSARTKTRGISKLAPAVVKNKISVVNGKVMGLDRLNKVEYAEVEELMKALGVEMPDRLTKRGKAPYKQELAAWTSSSNDDDEDSSQNQQERAQAKIDNILASEGIARPRRVLPKADLEAKVVAAKQEGQETVEWMGRQVVTSPEWEPTSLQGAMVVDPAEYSRPEEKDSEDEWNEVLESDNLTSWQQDGQDPTLHMTEDGPDFNVLFGTQTSDTLNDADSGPKSSSSPAASSSHRYSPPTNTLASHPFSVDDIYDSDTSDFSPAAKQPKMLLSSLGPAWMGSYEHTLSPKEEAAAAKDRDRTLRELYGQVPSLVSIVSR